MEQNKDPMQKPTQKPRNQEYTIGMGKEIVSSITADGKTGQPHAEAINWGPI